MSESKLPKSPDEINKEVPSELKVIEQELVTAEPDMIKVFSGLNKNKKETILRSASLVIKQHSGPLPDPESLADYNRLIPNGAERIMTMAEKQQNHGFEMERTALRRASFQYLLGQIFAFVLVALAIGFGYELTKKGFEKVGITIFATTIGVILYTFVLGRKSKSTDKDKIHE